MPRKQVVISGRKTSRRVSLKARPGGIDEDSDSEDRSLAEVSIYPSARTPTFQLHAETSPLVSSVLAGLF